MASEIDIEMLRRPGGIVPIDVETTAGLVRTALRLDSELTAARDREFVLTRELNKLVIKHSDTLNELDKAVLTIRDWHTAARTMRDHVVLGKPADVEDIYFNAAMKLPFYGAQGELLPSERKPATAA